MQTSIRFYHLSLDKILSLSSKEIKTLLKVILSNKTFSYDYRSNFNVDQTRAKPGKPWLGLKRWDGTIPDLMDKMSQDHHPTF